jgi:DNA recombination protein RmuC
MAGQTLEWIAVVLSLMALAGIGAVLLRLRYLPSPSTALASDVERLERTIQAIDTKSFTNAEARADALRKEVAENVQRFADQLGTSVARIGDGQKHQFEAFERMLTNQVRSVDERIVQLSEQQKTALDNFGASASENWRLLRDEIANRLKSATDDLKTASESAASQQKERLDDVSVRLVQLSEGIVSGFEKFQTATEASLKTMRIETSDSLAAIRKDTETKLEQMRLTVDEKLHDTLEKRLGQQFGLVLQQLKQVHEGLGDMQKLATGVGDLKRVLTNVKVRGTWTEVQLARILEDMLSPDQYERNVRVRPESSEIVEFCIKIPKMGEGDEPLLLPLDAKFPIEDYERLLACAEVGDMPGVEAAGQKLEARFRACAKDISSKYIAPPRTTDYALMYVPSEGLYAEIVKRPGLASSIAQEFNVVIAGPTNVMSIVNAVQAVGRSVMIQQKASEIAKVLLKVQFEFGKFGKSLASAKRRALSTVDAMEKLDQRHRVLGKALSNVNTIESEPLSVGYAGLIEPAVGDGDELEGAGVDEAADEFEFEPEPAAPDAPSIAA